MEETKKIQAIADQKVLLGETKVKKLQKELNEAIKAKTNAEKLLTESQEIIQGFVEVTTTEAAATTENMDVDAEEEDDSNPPAETVTVNAKKDNRKKMEKAYTGVKFDQILLSLNDNGNKEGEEYPFEKQKVDLKLACAMKH